MNNNLTEVIFIMDASGSMSYLTNDTIGGFNTLIEKHKKAPGGCKITTVLFSNDCRKIHDCVDIKDIKPMTKEDYIPYGMTALYDAVGKTVDEVGVRLAATPEEERPGKVIVVITTDGNENYSTKYSHQRIKEMIELQQNTYNWTFMFLGANINAEETGASYGIKQGYSHTYTASSKGVESVYNVVTDSLNYIQTKTCNNEAWNDEDDLVLRSCLSSVE